MDNTSKVVHFISIMDHSAEFLSNLIDRAIEDKKLFKAGKLEPVLRGKTLAIYFEKPSLRTRLSFEVAMTQLGGHSVYLTDSDIALGKREPVKDVGRVISRMCDGFAARTFSHEVVEEFTKYASIPVINALTDYSHPCQSMADIMTVKEKFGRLSGLKLTFIGDGNNVARSLATICGKLGIKFALAAPEGYQLEEDFVQKLKQNIPDIEFTQGSDVISLTKDADILYTDTWISMGQENEKERRIKDFQGYQLNTELLKYANPDVIVMHCLPAYRGYEITDEVIESSRSVVFDQAENRLHFQRTLLAELIG